MNVSFCLAVCCVIGIVGGVPLPKDNDDPVYKLPENVSPESYEIDLEINDDFKTITGKVHIIVTSKDSSNVQSINLHIGDEIGVTGVLIDGEDIFDKQTLTPNENGISTIILENPEWQDNKIKITITYNLELSKVMEAFHITKYTDEGNEKTLLATHFQPVNARKVFPCFDEPALKAKFQLHLLVPEGYSALSNTHIEEENVSEGINKITFKETPKMSTNLLAFVIYDTISYITDDNPSPDDDDIKFRTWKLKSTSRSEASTDATEMGMEYGPEIIKAMTEYSEIPYTENGVSKIDQAALPQYVFEPMETYGLTNFHESVLLSTKEQLSELLMEQEIEIMTRSLVHHWIGDRVTPEWWSYLWLSEGFAKYFEYYLTDKVMEGEEWRMDEKFIVHEQMRAMQEDAYEDSVSLTNEDVKTPEDIKAQFGIISSSKGASVLRMFENIVGETKFKEAVNEFLKVDDDPVTPEDFLTKLQEDEKPSVENYETWTNQPGFPLVTIKKKDNAFKISQERFTYTLEVEKTKEDETPLCYYLALKTISQTNADGTESILTDCELKDFEMPEKDKWYLVSTTGYFRVNYDEENWELLAKELSPKNEVIKALERAVLVDNALNIARAGKLDYKLALNVVSYLEEEDDYIPWAAAIPGLDFLHHMLGSNEDNRDTIDKFIKHISSHVYKTLEERSETEKENMSHNDKILRSKVRHLACRAGDEDCLGKAKSEFNEYVGRTKKIDLDLQSSVYCYGHTDKSQWDKLWIKLTNAEEMERSVIIAGLGCSTDESILKKYLEELISDGTVIRQHEIPDVFAAVYTNVMGTNIALTFLKEHIEDIEDKTDVISIMKDMAKYLKTEEQMDELESIKDHFKDQDSKEDVQKIINTVDINKTWKDKMEDDVISAIKETVATTTDPSETTVPSTETTTPGGASSARAVVAIIIFAFAFVFNF